MLGRRHVLSRVLNAVVVVVCLVEIMPLYWLLITSIKTEKELFQLAPLSPPAHPTLDNYGQVFLRKETAFALLNSFVITTLTVALATVVGSLAAYSLVRFRFRGSRLISLGMLVIRTLPPVIMIVPLYMLNRSLGLIDSWWALIIAYLFFTVPFVTWMMRGFFIEVPKELEECAMVDGCSRLAAFSRVVLPLAAPGLAATAIFAAIATWNEFILALILTNSSRSQTVPIILGQQITWIGILWSNIAAMGVVLILPILALSILVQKYFVRGLTAGAVKG